MNQNAELLNFIYQNSQMGVSTISQLLKIAKDDAAFKSQLQTQFEEYNEVHEEAKQKLNANGYDEKGITALEKLKTYLMINMQTLTDKSSSHIAEMLIIGSNMGVLDAVKNLKKYPAAEIDIRELMQKLVKIEENNVQQLKKLL